MSKRSAIIPHRGPTLGLWATIAAIESQSPLDEYCIHVNGKEPDEPFTVMQRWLGDRIKFSVGDAVNPAMARNRAVELSSGDELYFFDDHVIPGPRYFELMRPPENAICHSSYVATGGYRYYHFIPGDELETKGDYATTPLSESPYPCISAGHAGFSMRRTTWDKLGGYGDFWVTFGGEEAYLGLKARSMGIAVMMNPQAYFYHFSARSVVRGYDKEIDDSNYQKALDNLKSFIA